MEFVLLLFWLLDLRYNVIMTELWVVSRCVVVIWVLFGVSYVAHGLLY